MLRVVFTHLALWALFFSAAAFAQDGGSHGRIIVLVPLGDVDEGSMKVVKAALEQRVDGQVRIDEQRRLPKAAWYGPRKRWRAEKLLDALEADPPPDAWKVVAVTAAEISTTKEQYVDWRIAGLGSLGGRSCVLSTWIYRKHFDGQAKYDRRLEDLTVHEFGHTLGLEHCPTEACVMRDAMGKALQSADSSTTNYCARCRANEGAAVLKPIRK